MMHPCQNCDHPAPEDTCLCKPCALHFSKLPERARQLIHLLDEPRTGLSEPRSTSTEPGIPINPEAVDLRRDLEHQLATLPPIYEPDAHLAFRDLEDTTRAATHLVDIPREKQLLGPCWDCDNGTLTTYKDSTIAKCDTCPATWDAPRLRAWKLIEACKNPMPIKTAVEYLKLIGAKINYRTAQSWARRGNIPTDEHGNVLLEDLHKHAASRRH